MYMSMFISPSRPLSQPELGVSTLTSDLTALLEEACLPGSVSDLEIKVGRHLLVLIIMSQLMCHHVNTNTVKFYISRNVLFLWARIRRIT